MKNRKRKRSRPPSQQLGPRQPASPTGLPTLPVFPARARGPRAGPARRPRPRTRLPRSLPLPVGPCMSAAHSSTMSSSSPTPQPPTRPAPDSGGRAGQGSRPGHGPVFSLHRAHATSREPLDATEHASTARSPSAIGAWSSAIKLGPRLP